MLLYDSHLGLFPGTLKAIEQGWNNLQSVRSKVEIPQGTIQAIQT